MPGDCMPSVRNYQKELDRFIEVLSKEGRKPKLLLHSCCGPCSSYVMEYLSKYFDITVYYYDPNIEPAEEYFLRLEEQKRLVSEMFPGSGTEVTEGEYEPERYHDCIKGLEEEPEGGARCERCFRLRLEKTAETALKNGFEFFTTTLTVSPHKNAPLINAIGEETAKKYGVKFLNSDFKKRDGFKRSIELSEQYGLYRQNYCGCIYSRREQEQ